MIMSAIKWSPKSFLQTEIISVFKRAVSLKKKISGDGLTRFELLKVDSELKWLLYRVII